MHYRITSQRFRNFFSYHFKQGNYRASKLMQFLLISNDSYAKSDIIILNYLAINKNLLTNKFKRHYTLLKYSSSCEFLRFLFKR